VFVKVLTFPKQQKLCGSIRVNNLFKEGATTVVFPYRMTYRWVDASAEPKVLIWAPKKLFRHAVQRNRLRRQMREAYRLNASPLKDYCLTAGRSLELAFVYMAPDMVAYKTIDKGMQKALKKLLDTQSISPTNDCPQT